MEENKELETQSLIINEGIKGLATEPPQKRKLVELVTAPLLLGALYEVGKAAIGFFAGLLLKKWWDRREAKKKTPPDNIA